MSEFDPRRPPSRIVARLIMGVASLALAGLGYEMFGARALARLAPPQDPVQLNALQHQAFTAAEALPGFARPEHMQIQVATGETLQGAVLRAGIGPGDARELVATLASAMDVANVEAGFTLDAAVARRRGGDEALRLIGVSLRTGPATTLAVTRTFDGAMRLRELSENIRAERTVASGAINGSLSETAAELGAGPAITNQMVKLFGHKVDFDRDLKLGDRIDLIYDRAVTESGRTVQTGDLIYAAIKGIRFYRFDHGGKADYFDANGENIRGFLLRTPVASGEVTSGFGMRRHPILGYNRMHQGIDFAAGTGTPVMAAGDGVVEDAGRWGGYGNWLKIRHSGGWATGYAHLLKFAPGVSPGQTVHQGQVVAYVGTTGLSTGPHLHYEIWLNGSRVDPVSARVPQGIALAGDDLQAFRTEKIRIDKMLAKGSIELSPEPSSQVASADPVVALRR